MKMKIDEIKKALKNNMPESALALTLILPDICSQVEYPQEQSVTKRYKDWIDKYLSQDAFNVNHDGIYSQATGISDGHVPKLGSEEIYQIRCHFLHSGEVDIGMDSGNQKTSNLMNVFEFNRIGKGDGRDENGMGLRSGYQFWIKTNSGVKYVHYRVDVDYFCEKIYEAADKYYNDNQDKKSDFESHEIIFVS